MIAVDTNLVVRLIVADDPDQAATARDVFATKIVFVPTTVFLETAWVLGHIYGASSGMIVAAFRRVAGLPNVHVEAPDQLAQAIDWALLGLDFADALHLASARHCDSFLTFDRAFAKAARDVEGPSVRAP